MREDYLTVERIVDQLKDGATGVNHEQATFLVELIESLKLELKEKTEHSNVHYGKDEFIGIDGYGPYSLRKVCKERWEVVLSNEKVTLFNRKGKRVRGEVQDTAKDWDGDW